MVYVSSCFVLFENRSELINTMVPDHPPSEIRLRMSFPEFFAFILTTLDYLFRKFDCLICIWPYTN
jgi:hypothetical protein